MGWWNFNMTALKTGSVWWPLNLPPSSHSNQTSLSSLCPSVKCCCTASASLSPLLCVLRAPWLQVHSLSAHYRWARERELTSHPPLGSLKPSAVPLPPPPPSHRADHTNQALIYSIYTILLLPLWLQRIWGMVLLSLPSVLPASC